MIILNFIDRVDFQYKVCRICNSFHFFSYAVKADTNKKYFYGNSSNEKYFQLTKETIYEVKLLKHFISDVVFKHATFRNFAQSYNNMQQQSIEQRFRMNPKNLASIFFCYHLQIFYYEELKETLIGKTLFEVFFDDRWFLIYKDISIVTIHNHYHKLFDSNFYLSKY